MQSGGSDSRRPSSVTSCCSRKRWSKLALCATSSASPGEGEEAAHDGGGRRGRAQLRLAQAGQPRDRLGQRHARVDERLEGVDELEPAHAYRAQLADPVARRREAGRLEVEDDELGLLQRRVDAAVRERDAAADAGHAAVAGGQLAEQRARQPGRDRRRREERPGGLDGRQRAAFLERVDQAVERVERELHPSKQSEHTFALQVVVR